ncbi:MAG: YciI family protein [Gammaproteobacteria bacterium]|nr:YciI family protein [Gammaproteobacteria bacterium]
MQYMCLIYSDDNLGPTPGTDEFGKMIEEYQTFTQEVQQAGAMVAGDALQPVSTATTVRAKGGTVTTTDGPFAETKETLGGYYLLECANLDEALAYAARIPTAKYGSIEVRPVQVFD